MSLENLAERAAKLFGQCCGNPPQWTVAAPGRVNLIGEHTDYNNGFVLPMAIERYTVAVADRNSRREIIFHSATTGETARINLRSPIERGEPAWANYPRGVIAGFQRRGVKVEGFEAVIDSSVPFGGGLSSSAALEVAVATLLEAITGQKLDPVEKALLCQRAEHEFARVPCGIMDQFTSVLARESHLLLLDCRSRATELVPVKDTSVTVLIVNTNVRHKLADGEYAKRRAQCESAAKQLGVPSLREVATKALPQAQKQLDPLVFRRARHVVTENERTVNAARAFRESDWATLGELMYASHASLRDDYEVSCPELDVIVEIAGGIGKEGGVIGCRMTGGGFGGCAVSLVKTDAVKDLIRKISDAYEKKTRIQPTVFSSRPASGARILRSPK